MMVDLLSRTTILADVNSPSVLPRPCLLSRSNRSNVLGFNRLSFLHTIEISPQALLVILVTKMIAMLTIPGPTGWAFSTFSHCQECKPNISTKLWSSNLIFRNQKSRVKTLHLRLKIYPKSLISRLNLVFIPTHNKFPEPLSWKRWRWAQPLFSSSSGRSFPTQ